MERNTERAISRDIKKQILDYVYQTIPLSRYKFKILEHEDDLKYLKQNTHYVACNYVGYNYLLVFIKLKDNYYSFLIDRKTLKYNSDYLDIDQVNMKPIRLQASIEIYDGTILDGVLINTPESQTYIITDTYYLTGKSELREELKTKLNHMKEFMAQNIKNDSKISHINLEIETFYNYDDLPNLTQNIFPKSKYRVRGLVFYPKFSGTKIIYTFPQADVAGGGSRGNIKQKTINSDAPENDKMFVLEKKNDKMTKSNVSQEKEKTALFELRKIAPDVYDLYLYDETSKKTKKYGIAGVPDKKCSLFCRETFEQNTDQKIIMKCVYSEKFHKWIPSKFMASVQRPDAFSFVS